MHRSIKIFSTILDMARDCAGKYLRLRFVMIFLAIAAAAQLQILNLLAQTTTPASDSQKNQPSKQEKHQADEPGKNSDSGSDAPVQFNPAFIHGDQKVDLSRFSIANLVDPGEYSVDIYVNGDKVTRDTISFTRMENEKSAHPCFSSSMMVRLGIDMQNMDAKRLAALANRKTCIRLADLWQDANVLYDSSEMRLDIVLPQAVLTKHPRGYVDPKLWDAGQNAAFVNYIANSYYAEGLQGGSKSYRNDYLSLMGGVNLGLTQFRTQQAYSKMTGSSGVWQNVNSYVQRSFASIRSKATAGQTFTPGNYFDSVSFTGAEFMYDETMLPDSQRLYAPVVRGIARTSARVIIQQGNSILFETTVTPGPFEITDIYPTGYAGDLQVTVKEADGTVQYFTVPFSALPQLLRTGNSRYSLTYGKLRNDYLKDTPLFFEGSYAHGVSNLITLYGSTQISSNFFADLWGIGLNTSIGAYAITGSTTHRDVPNESNLNGTYFRISNSHTLARSKTNLSLLAFSYATRGYITLTNSANINTIPFAMLTRQKARFEANVGQPLGKYGQLTVSALVQNNWNSSNHQSNYLFSYINHYRWLSYSISAGRTLDKNFEPQRNLSLNLSIPIKFGRSHSMVSTTSTNAIGDDVTVTSSVSGSALKDNTLSFGAQVGYDSDLNQRTWGVNAQKQFSFATLQASTSRSNQYQQYAAGLSGSLTGYRHGIAAGPPIGDTFAIIEAPGAAGARVMNGVDIRINRFGYAVLPFLMPYHLNDIHLGIDGLNSNVELKETAQEIVPYAGAVLGVKFTTVSGRPVLITMKLENGDSVPLSADVLDEKGKNVGLVGQDSRAYVRGIAEKGHLTVKWGQSTEEQCSVSYTLPPVSKASNSLTEIKAVCTR